MRKGILLFVAACFWSVSAWAGFQDFTLVNRTGVTINEFYVSAVDTNDWEEDVLGLEVLGNGESVKIRFSWSESQCNWDFLVVDEDEDEIVWEGIDLCRYNKVFLYWSDGRPYAEFE
jgi:hypothetical protein